MEHTPSRRAFISLVSTGGAAALAGCSDSGNNGSDDGTTDPDEENHGKSEENKNSVEILEHGLVRENEGAVSETARVEGRAENVGDSSLTIAEIRVQFFNKIGDIIVTSIANVNYFKPGQTWAFTVRANLLGEDAAEIDEYNISVGTTF